MRIKEISEYDKLSDITKIARTNEFKLKVENALRVIEALYSQSDNITVSCGGGKDGTAVLILTKMLTPDFKIICADPPNPITGRAEHIANLEQCVGQQFIHIPYNWDVEAVLNGETAYPEGLKQKELSKYQVENKCDIIWGCRNEESRARTINYAKNGEIYKVANGTLRCQPIAKWSAEDSLALAIAEGYPINDVYKHMDGFLNLNDIHDGTWWAHGSTEKGGWLKKYYPECYENYLRSLKVADSYKKCTY